MFTKVHFTKACSINYLIQFVDNENSKNDNNFSETLFTL